MGNKSNDLIADQALDFIADNADRIFACSAEPASYAEASDTYMLASKTLTVGDGNGVFTKRDAVVAPNGRELVVASQVLAVTTTGTANHVALCDSVNERVLTVRQMTTPRDVVSGTTMQIAEFVHAISDLTALA